jgi:F-type H+-transporting ATPase subunit b
MKPHYVLMALVAGLLVWSSAGASQPAAEPPGAEVQEVAADAVLEPAEGAPAAEVALEHGAAVPEAHGEHGHGEHEEHGGGADFYKGLNILVILIVLAYILSSPIKKLLGERSRSIAQELEDAKGARDAAQKELQECLATLADASAELERARTEGRRQAEIERENILARAREEGEKIERNTSQRIAAEIAEAKRELRAFVTQLIREQVTGRLQKKMTPELQDDLIKRVDLISIAEEGKE